MAANYLSFDVGEKNIKLVEGWYKGDAAEILKATSIQIPRGTLKDSFILNKKILGLAMQEAISKLNTNSKDVIVTMSSNSIFIREFELPTGDEKELEGMVKNEITQYYEVTARDLVEYRKISDLEQDGIKKVKIRAAVMNKEMAADYYDLVNSLGLKPIALDTHPNVISKVFKGQFAINGQEYDLQNFLLLDIGYAGSVVYFVMGGNLEFSRYIHLGGKSIDSLLANLYSITEEEAENSKVSKMKELVPFDEQNTLWSAVRPLYADMMEELRKVIQFSLSRRGNRVIHSIYLMGGGAGLYGLAEYLSQGLGIDVQRIETLSKINNKIDINNETLASLINAAGALIRL